MNYTKEKVIGNFIQRISNLSHSFGRTGDNLGDVKN